MTIYEQKLQGFSARDFRARLGGLSNSCLHSLIGSGKLRVVYVGSKIIILKEELERILQEGLPGRGKKGARRDDAEMHRPGSRGCREPGREGVLAEGLERLRKYNTPRRSSSSNARVPLWPGAISRAPGRRPRRRNGEGPVRPAIPSPRLRRQAELIHALGPRPLASLLAELAAGAPIEERLEVYARLPAGLIKAYRGDVDRTELLAIRGGRCS